MSVLFNPYQKIAGGKALLIGFLFALITLVIATSSHAVFDGVLDFHKTYFENWWVYSAFYIISWIIIVLFFGLAGFLFSKSRFRWIDILGTTLIAKAPLLIVAVVGYIIPEAHLEDLDDVLSYLTFMNVAASIVILLCIIWMVALLFNAYAVSLNIKGNKQIWSFILILLLAEIFSKIIIYYLPF